MASHIGFTFSRGQATHDPDKKVGDVPTALTLTPPVERPTKSFLRSRRRVIAGRVPDSERRGDKTLPVGVESVPSITPISAGV